MSESQRPRGADLNDRAERDAAGVDAPAPDDPRKPDWPPEMHAPSWAYVARTTVREFSRDRCLDQAAALTYYGVMAAAPALLALVSLLGLFGNAQTMVNDVVDSLGPAVPDDVRTMIGQLVTSASTGGGRAGIALVVGVVLAVWSASGYVGAFGRAMNRVYEIDEGRPIWKLRPVLLLVTVVALVVAATVVGALVVSGSLARAVGDAVGVGSTAQAVWNVAKWPVVLVLVVLLVALLYDATPNVRQPRFRWISVGALVAIVVWLVASAAFGFYVATFGHYDATYGPLGGIVVFLLWLWITNIALLFGAELDSEVERGRELQGGIAAEERIQLPPRDTRASDKRTARREAEIRRGRRLREAAGRRDHEDADRP